MSQKYPLPHYFKYRNLNLKVDNYKDEYFDEIFQLFQDGKRDSAGTHLIFRNSQKKNDNGLNN